MGLALLLMGACALAFVIWSNDRQGDSNAELRAQRDRLAASLRPGKLQEKMQTEDSAKIGVAGAAYARIMRPWGGMFHALESSRSDEIAILSLVADATRKEIALSGEAKDFAALSRFSDTLSGNPAFMKVELADHKLIDGAPRNLVRFELKLAWHVIEELRH